MGAGGLFGPLILLGKMPTMPIRTTVFVDGANFRANLRDFAFTSHLSGDRQYRLQERHFNWKEFFAGVLGKFDLATGWQHQLIRVYWYRPETISPWLANEQQRLSLAQRVINSNPNIEGLTPQMVVDLAFEWYQRERRNFERMREHIFEDIQRSTDFLEFKYVGQYQVHPLQAYRIEQREDGTIEYLGRQVGEKGVDTGIAVDMIAKMVNYDAAILVSGDADFLPVVGYLKDNLKYVYQFSIARGVPPMIRYLSPYLRGKVDCFESYDEVGLLSLYLNRESRIPLDILEAIDARVSGLQGMLSP